VIRTLRYTQGMTISYYLENPRAIARKDIASYPEFYNWLWSLGAGVREGDPQTRVYWAETYRNLTSPGEVKPFKIGLSRGLIGSAITILGRR